MMMQDRVLGCGLTIHAYKIILTINNALIIFRLVIILLVYIQTIFTAILQVILTHYNILFQFYYSIHPLLILVCTGLVEGVMGDGFHLVVQLYDTTKV